VSPGCGWLVDSACGIQLAVQELEAYSPVALTPSVTGDGPVASAIAGRLNPALAALGGVAFSSSDLTPDYAAAASTTGSSTHRQLLDSLSTAGRNLSE